MIIISFILTFIGFFALSLTMQKHAKQIFTSINKPRYRLSKIQMKLLTTTGHLGLMLAALICIQHSGWALGLVYWTGLLTIAAFSQSMFLSYGLNTSQR
ncbi:MAG: DUF3325 domain-containing protein [Paraglaciecola sp.]|uniref:DUF3325 domain-containing protein n=1 Tax=Paraglaciecola sp. TaxID=1920173 RepID=UPI00329A17C6